MIGDGIKNTHYQGSFYQQYEFGRQQPTTSEMPQFPTETASNPFDSNFFLSNHFQKPVFDQSKYNDIYCNPSMYSGMYLESGYTDEIPTHLMPSEWRQTVHQSNWDVKSESKNAMRTNTDINEQYFRKSSIINSTCSQDIGSSSDYSPLDSFPRNMNSVKSSQYYYPSISFGNTESKLMTRINSTYSSDNSSFSSVSPKINYEMNKSSKVLSELTSSQNDFDKIKKTHIKKPLNAFMLFMKEMRSRVVAECTLKESAAINQILGRRWHALTREEQTKYYEMARKEKELHQHLYPNWSARDNYASHTKRKKKRTNTLFQMSYFNHGNSFKSSHQINGQKFQSEFHDQSMLDQNPLIFGNKCGLLSNHNFFYKPDSPYHIDPLLALHYGSSFSDKLSFTNNPQCFNSTWSTSAVTDSLINVNKDCPSDLQIGSNLEISSERLQDNTNMTERIPDIQNRDVELAQANHSQKQHLVSESVF